jgi:glycosyltransferase involved in cell wall biosynthesis
VTADGVVIGAPLYNHGEYLEATLESLLGQSHRDFSLILLDDCSTDETARIARWYAAQDERVSYDRNPERLGLVGSWRRSFELARSLHPDAEYFAWGSDHDLWHPNWLAECLAEMDGRPEVVLVYPRAAAISDTGEVTGGTASFETLGVPWPRQRLRMSYHRMAAGSMVYGLMRARALARAGVYRRVLEPDRLLLCELSLQGQFRQVNQTLFHRRFRGVATRERQRRAIFLGRRRLYSRLSPRNMHVLSFLWVYAVRGGGRPEVGRTRGLVLTVQYYLTAVHYASQRRIARLRKRWRRARKRARRNARIRQERSLTARRSARKPLSGGKPKRRGALVDRTGSGEAPSRQLDEANRREEASR